MVKSFNLVINLNDILSPQKLKKKYSLEDISIFAKLLDQLFPNHKTTDLIIPNLSKPYVELLCKLAPRADISLYFDDSHAFSLYASETFFSSMHRVKTLYSFENVSSYLTNYFQGSKVDFKTFKTIQLRGYIQKLCPVITTIKAKNIIIVNAVTDTDIIEQPRELTLNNCKRSLALSNTISDSAAVYLRANQIFSELDLLVLKKWYWENYERILTFVRTEQDFFSILLENNAIVIGHRSFELMAARELSQAPVIVMEESSFSEVPQNFGDFSAEMSSPIFKAYFLQENQIRTQNGFKTIIKASNVRYSNALKIVEQTNLECQIKSLLFFTNPVLYISYRNEISSYLENCSDEIFSYLFPEIYFKQAQIALIIDAWEKALHIQNSLSKTRFEYQNGNKLASELACWNYLRRHKSPTRKAFLASILFSDKRRKHAFKLLFSNRPNFQKKYLFLEHFYVLLKFFFYYLKK